MIVPIEHVGNWRLIYQRKQKLIDRNTDQENSTRTTHHSKVDDKVLIRNNQGKKMKPHIRYHIPSYKRVPMGR